MNSNHCLRFKFCIDRQQSVSARNGVVMKRNIQEVADSAKDVVKNQPKKIPAKAKAKQQASASRPKQVAKSKAANKKQVVQLDDAAVSPSSNAEDQSNQLSQMPSGAQERSKYQHHQFTSVSSVVVVML